MNEEIEMLYKKIDAQDKIINEQLKEISRFKKTREEGYYKTFSELKNELGEEFEIFLYNSNIELLDKIDKAIEYIKQDNINVEEEKWVKSEILKKYRYSVKSKLLEILGEKENE